MKTESPIAHVTKAYVYVLECEGGYYYVGRTTDLRRRMNTHNQGRGSDWTISHKPLKIVKAWETSMADANGEHGLENYVTRELMKQKGYQKVRGGKWLSGTTAKKAKAWLACPETETAFRKRHRQTIGGI